MMNLSDYLIIPLIIKNLVKKPLYHKYQFSYLLLLMTDTSLCYQGRFINYKTLAIAISNCASSTLMTKIF